MLKASELRIGNYIIDNFGRIAKVEIISEECGVQLSTTQHSADSLSDSQDYERCFGIPLTPKTLEKCGFKKSHHGYYELSTEQFNLAFDEDGLDIVFMDNDIGNSLNHIQYLHQLQNLYFALTGKELNISL